MIFGKSQQWKILGISKNISGLNIPTIMHQFCPLNFVTVLKQQEQQQQQMSSPWLEAMMSKTSWLNFAGKSEVVSCSPSTFRCPGSFSLCVLVWIYVVALLLLLELENHRVGLNYKLEKIQQNYYQIVGRRRERERGSPQNWFCYYFCC